MRAHSAPVTRPYGWNLPLAEATLVTLTRAALAEDGVFAQTLPGFQPRHAQQQMAQAVAETLSELPSTLLVEAATGVGKTFAYLVPALLSGRRVLISTGTKTLQDQLFEKDLPLVCKALQQRPRLALLKGRANYLCLYRLEIAEQDAAMQGHTRTQAQLVKLRRYAQHSTSGDLTLSAILPDDAPLWPQVTSTADNCLGGECPQWTQCFVQQARRRAQDATLVVVNHHLLLADLALKDEGFAELLPNMEAVIIDEAHQLPDIAGSFFGIDVSTRALRELGRDIQHEVRQNAREIVDLPPLVAELEEAVQALLRYSLNWPARSSAQEWGTGEAFGACMEALDQALQTLETALGLVAERSPGLDQARQRSSLLRGRLQSWRAETPATVAWAERFRQSLILHRTPLDAAKPLATGRALRPASWIFTSATLAVGEDFSHAARRLGLPEEVRCEQLNSPFDYTHQACVVVPNPPLPNPNQPGYTTACLNWAWPLLDGNPGGGFLLFTSHRALQEAAHWLRERLGEQRPVLVQGELPKATLLQQFRAAGNAWLLGAHSFWEGVDIRGTALSVVLIDRLPFAVPNDPVLQARTAAINEAGGNAFMQLQMPQAVLALKQGVGRLIRDAEDVGILALCDPRLTSKPYGRQFWASLPPFQQVRDPASALGFLQNARDSRSA